MIRISVEHACSFARGIDEELSSPEQFFAASRRWLKGQQRVLATLSYEMASRLSADETAAAAAHAVVGCVLRLMAHAGANQRLERQWSDLAAHVAYTRRMRHEAAVGGAIPRVAHDDSCAEKEARR